MINIISKFLHLFHINTQFQVQTLKYAFVMIIYNPLHIYRFSYANLPKVTLIIQLTAPIYLLH